MKRMILVYSDGRSEYVDIKPNAEAGFHKMHMADMVVEVDVASGRTEVVKNRWGDRGTVER